MYTIIDSDKYREAGIEVMFFPGGEPHIKLTKDISHQDILFYVKPRTWNDVAFAALVINALRKNPNNVYPFIPYFPAARQDKVDHKSAMTAEITARMFSFGKRVSIFDPHSPVIVELLDALVFNWLDLPPVPRIETVAGIIAPDKGAIDRASQYRSCFYPKAELLNCTKTRNQETGQLGNTIAPRLPVVGHYIVVDDICDGGGTFNLLMKAFDADPIVQYCTFELMVSHGIFSRGLEAIDSRFTRITTTDSWCKLPQSDRLRVVGFKTILDI
jgi:ribose-phosphate pyrophosphokinase